MDWFTEYKNLVFSSSTSVDKIKRSISLKYEHIPKILYKYRSVDEYSLKNLEDDSIWLSDPRNFNDPYDCSFHHKTDLNPNDANFVLSLVRESNLINELTEQQIQSISGSNNPLVRLLELSYPDRPEYGKTCGEALSHVMRERASSLVSQTSEGFKQAFKICCFSENPKSILMWSHYADYHSGFCIGYNFHELGRDDVRTSLLYPVIYSDEMFNATGVFRTPKTVNNSLYLNQAALMKSTEWAYEKEWRLVFGNMVIQNERSYRMPKPKHIILGSKISPENEQTIRRVCYEKNIEVLKLSMAHDRFVLDIEQ